MVFSSQLSSPPSGFCMSAAYVLGILLTGSSLFALDAFVSSLGRTFSLKDLDPAHYFLVMEITAQPHGIILTQWQYILDLLKRASMAKAKPLTSPMAMNSKLSMVGGDSLSDPLEYWNIVVLEYLWCTPISYYYTARYLVLHQQSLSVSSLSDKATMKWIVRYLKNTIDRGRHFYSTSALLTLQAFSDAD
ncbi:PREDICTED: uncharacterized protein LOC109114135 [Nelumbo nucifera]|uniref:Uncharacterized protein LOC109114135 n=1 Tax=Nelumbo nucifera TaxID=4432 RepID=A0A1U8Q1G6_NELNU|nr:PREDICTED: uncharacterized protein LOC109114135 [Nelumbo nucifera]